LDAHPEARFDEQTAAAGAPSVMPFGMGMVGPVIYTFGNEVKPIAKYRLGHERTGIAGVAGSKRQVRALYAVAERESSGSGQPLSADDDFMGRLRQGEVRLMSLEMTNLRMLSEISAGNSPGDASSVLKENS
jgi:hypothetical protein